MKRCSVKPYEGTQKYIFVSYCHKDKELVFPIIEPLTRDGYRVWYDEGIDPGSEWPEIIAQHLNDSTVCIAFITENSINSHNCRREINFALLKKKSFISVILKPSQMSLGMEMQLSATQAIYKYTLPDEKTFFKKLYDAQFLNQCYDLTLKEESKPEYISESIPQSEIKPEFTPELKSEPKLEPTSTSPVSKKVRAWIVRDKTGETRDLPEGSMKLGRSSVQSDYVILGNSAVGRFHAIISRNGSSCTLTDNHSMNKTYLSGRELEGDTAYMLKDGDSFCLANEKFTFHQIEE